MDPVEIVEGETYILRRDDVDTDQIVPKQFLKRTERSGYGDFLFWDWRKSGEIDLQPAPILLAGKNFGSGSSREHAVWALRDFGFRAVIAPSFSDIFRSNASRNGLLLVSLREEECQQIEGEVRIDLPDQTVTSAAGVFEFAFPERDKERLLLGLDEIEESLQKLEAIESWENCHPRGEFSTRHTLGNLE